MSCRLIVRALLLAAAAASSAAAGEIRGRVLVDDKPAAAVTVSVLPFEDGFQESRRQARREGPPQPLAVATSRPDGSFTATVAAPAGTSVRLALSGGRAAPRVLEALYDAGGDDAGDVRLPAAELIPAVSALGGIAAPCHPGRPTIGLCAHYEDKPPLEGIVAVEALNGGSRRGENERVQQLIADHGYGAFGGSDSHLVSFIGICATEFECAVRTIEDLVSALQGGGYRPIDFRERLRSEA